MIKIKEIVKHKNINNEIIDVVVVIDSDNEIINYGVGAENYNKIDSELIELAKDYLRNRAMSTEVNKLDLPIQL